MIDPWRVEMNPRTHQGHTSSQMTSATISKLFVISIPIDPLSCPYPVNNLLVEIGARGNVDG
jgi:hypothetical protein